MCYNVAYLEARAAKYAQRYKSILPPDIVQVDPELEFPTFYFVSGFQHPLLPLVTGRTISLYQWGLIPAWVKNREQAADISNKTLNAVGETAFDKPSFRKSIASQRALLGISGFYEWRDVNGVKYPYFVSVKDAELFSLGCIYESWVDKSSGEIISTFSILTTPANPLMEKIHNLKRRMPLIIPEADEHKWIDPSLKREEIESLIKPFDQENMKAFTVTREINSPRHNRNTPEAIKEVVYNEIPELH